jgi:hypothetical protein
MAVVRAVPVLLVRRDGDDVARLDRFDRTAPALDEAGARGDDQGLTERMRVPVAAGARLERHVGGRGARGLGRLKEGVDAHRAREMLGRRLL